MLIEQALEELDKYAEEFTNIGDARQAIKTNKDEFIQKWAKVNQYYKYIIKNVPKTSKEYIMAIGIVNDISQDNPSLEEWIQLMVEPKVQKQASSQDSSTFDIATITGPIESLTSEVMNMEYWDSEHIEGIELQLQEYKKVLISNKNSFEPYVYQSLMDDINIALNRINTFNKVINSDAMEDIKNL